MAGLLDLYGGALTPEQTQALQQRGLLGFLGGMQKSGALDYTAPFLSGKVPGGFAAGLAGGAGGMGEAQDAGALNAMRAQQLGLQAQMTRAQIGALTQEGLIASHLYGQSGAPSAAGPSTTGPGPAAAPGSPDTLLPSAGDSLADPRGLIPFIAQTATKYGIDPAVAVKVASSEGLSNPIGDGGTSGSALQLHVTPDNKGGAVGDLFQRTTGLDPLDPKNEKAAIDFGLRYAAQNGWGAWSGAKKLGLAPFAGIGAAPQGPGVFTAAMGGSGSSAPPQPGLLPQIAGANPRTGGVPVGTPGAAAPISAATAAAQNAQLRASGFQGLPTMPSNYIFGKGLVAPPGAGTVGGLLPQPAANAAPAPAGGLLAQAASGQPPAASPAPQPPAAAPGGMMPGGALPGGINPQAAQALAFLRTSRGAPVPDFVNQAAGMPFVGPKAYAEANAKGQVELQNAGPLARQKSLNTFENLRQGGILVDPSTGRIIAQAPRLPEGTSLEMGPGNQPVAREVPGAIPAIRSASEAQHGGQYQAEFGGIPGVQPGATAQPNATASAAPSKEPIPTPRGTLLPPTSQQFMPQSPSELKHATPAWQKKTDEWNAGIAPARQAEMRLTTIADAFKMTESGAFATHKAELAAALKSLGVDPGLVLGNPAAVQEALHDNILTTLPLLKAATPRPSQIEFMSVSENREHPNLQPSANLRMLSEDIALVRQAQQLPADWNMAQQQGWRNPQSFETAWSTLNPLDKARSQAASDVGPLKGMPGGPGSPAAPRRGVWNPKTGAVEWQ